MIVAGTVTYKMASRVRRLYNMMPDPKFVIAMGACTTGGGPYFKWGYHVVKGVDLVVPVDVYVPGCPPRPEALLEGLMRIQDKIKGHKITRKPSSEFSFAALGDKNEDELPVPHHSGYVDAPGRPPAALRSPKNHRLKLTLHDFLTLNRIRPWSPSINQTKCPNLFASPTCMSPSAASRSSKA